MEGQSDVRTEGRKGRVTQGQRDLVRSWQETGLWRAAWMMEGSGGDTTAIRMFGTSIRTSRALLRFSLNCVLWEAVVQETSHRSALPEDSKTN